MDEPRTTLLQPLPFDLAEEPVTSDCGALAAPSFGVLVHNRRNEQNNMNWFTTHQDHGARGRGPAASSQTAETDKLQAELMEWLKSAVKSARVQKLVGLIEQAYLQRDAAKKEEQEKQAKEHDDAVRRWERPEENLQQARAHLRTVRARMDPALLSTHGGVILPICSATYYNIVTKVQPEDRYMKDPLPRQ